MQGDDTIQGSANIFIIHTSSFGESLVDGLLNEMRNNHACIYKYMCF